MPAVAGPPIVRPIWGVGGLVVSCAPAPDAAPESIVPGEDMVRMANVGTVLAEYALTCPARRLGAHRFRR